MCDGNLMLWADFSTEITTKFSRPDLETESGMTETVWMERIEMFHICHPNTCNDIHNSALWRPVDYLSLAWMFHRIRIRTTYVKIGRSVPKGDVCFCYCTIIIITTLQWQWQFCFRTVSRAWLEPCCRRVPLNKNACLLILEFCKIGWT